MVKSSLPDYLVYREYRFSPDKPYITFLQHAENPAVLNMPHFHNYIEIGICHHPKGSVFLEGQTWPLLSEGFFLVPPFASHFSQPDEDSDSSEIDYFYFDPKLLMECVFPGFLSTAKTVSFPAGIPFLYPSREYPLLNRLLSCIVDELRSPGGGLPASINGLILAFFTELDALKAGRETCDQPRAAILPALHYLNGHYMEETSCRTLADLCGLCSGHFRRAFKTNTNLTISQYVNRLRIEAACGRMLQSEDSILDIALSVGFCSYSAFHGTFKALLGTSPRQWRNAHRRIHKDTIRHLPYREVKSARHISP
ncbi:MAG: AraC family transcriptional regulator [Lachnospiraceae bacterium]|nr:AraC family transcriptional regulator [Lachnospiraceae bacterium]